MPEEIQTLTLAVDVGLFFFLAGWAISFKEKRSPWDAFKAILEIWKQWIFFICIIGIVLIKTRGGINGLGDLISNFCFVVSIPQFMVIAGSIWFMPVYMVVTLVNSIVLYAINQNVSLKNERIISYRRYLIFLLFVFLFNSRGMILFPQFDNIYIFYSIFYVIGLIWGNKKFRISTWRFWGGMVILFSGMWLGSELLGMPISPMQNNKFPPNIIYMFYTFISIWIVMFVRKYAERVPRNVLSHIGKKAIWFYFSQGIGSSLLYSIMNKVMLTNVYIKWLILFGINLVLTALCAELLSCLYNCLRRSAVFVKEVL